MTRTERSTSLRAIMKDRSQPRNAMGQELKKDGAGPHNWGALRYEQELEEDAQFDGEREYDGEEAPVPREEGTTSARRPSVTLTEEEKRRAAEIRKNALRSPDVDLAAIARSSHAVSHSQDEQPTPVTGVSTGTKNSP
ncbi:uncharacterized protein PHACADRAFT_255021 [Phanerochaete carnosa HHB-10118-sp]|uniref:Hyaluronan/mRNA-binding protein domain-containing protein n=1 Tax=Phanerochaete carnosa (strain HHB-10118-sp) TaxID=650164 RepID=K5X3G4_PHACS|nr:uncharacterized protein PHACADRAFT_255021 [Phanerochaete carnosa HHB-10118-sp]EKM57322.1 hypothetical protein PHACADRAFT_255021 [Phanerochaete carnosa HHB-10118-sp]